MTWNKHNLNLGASMDVVGWPWPNYNFHRTAEVGRHLWRSSTPTTCSEQGQQEQYAQGHVQLGFEYLQHGDSTNSRSNLFQCLTTLTSKKFVLTFKWNFLYFNLCFSPLVLLLHITKSLTLSSLLAPIRHLYTLVRSCLSLLFSRLNSPSSLSLSWYIWCSELLIIIEALGWTCSSMSVPHLSQEDQDWTQHSRSVSPVLSRGEESPPLICWQCFS